MTGLDLVKDDGWSEAVAASRTERDLVAIDCSTCPHCSARHCADDHRHCQPNMCPCPQARSAREYEPEFAGCVVVGFELSRRLNRARSAVKAP